MKFIDNLYVSKSIKNVKRVIWKMRRNIGQIKVYITTISKHPTDQLDIYHCSILQQKYFRLDEDFIVVAITSTHKEAVEFVQYAVEDCLKVRGDCNVKEYLLSESFQGIISDRG